MGGSDQQLPQGSVHGFTVRSPIRLRYLREGETGPPLFIEEDSFVPADPGVLLEETPVAPGQAGRTRTFADGAAFNVWIDHAGWFRVEPTRSLIIVPPTEHGVWREALIWALPMALAILGKGDVAMHAAAADFGKGAVVLAAPGRHGKTTLAAAVHDSGYRLLSEDILCVTRRPWRVYPGPALIRLRRDVASLAPAGTQPFTEDIEKTHLAIDVERRGTGEPVPLRAVVLLRPSETEPRLTRSHPLEVIPDLWSSTLNVPNDQGRARCFDDVVAMSEEVEVWNLWRPLRLDALPATVDVLSEAFS